MQRPQPVRDLDWDADQARDLTERMLGIWSDLLEGMRDLPVSRVEPAEQVAEAMRLPIPESPMPLDQLELSMRQMVFEHSTLCGHPGFLAYISGAGTDSRHSRRPAGFRTQPQRRCLGAFASRVGARTAPDAVDGRAVRTAQRRRRLDDERRCHLQPDGPQGSARQPRRPRDPRRWDHLADGDVRLAGGARHDRGGRRHARAGRAGGAADPHRRSPPHAQPTCWNRPSRRTSPPASSRSPSPPPPAPPGRVRSIHWRRWPRSAGATSCGFTWMPPTVAARCSRRRCGH